MVSPIQNAWTQVFQGPGTCFRVVRGSRGSGISGGSRFLTSGLQGRMGAVVGKEQPLPSLKELLKILTVSSNAPVCFLRAMYCVNHFV